ncbi:MAG: adenosylcobinamide-phosphate synthase CbiB [Pseudomonadota bacterium]
MSSDVFASAPALMLYAMIIEAAMGWPHWLYRRLRHPTVWMGSLIAAFENSLNQSGHTASGRRWRGVSTVLIVVGMTFCVALLVSLVTGDGWVGIGIQAFVAASLVASRSLYEHVAAVATPLIRNDLAGARAAVSHIVGRDPSQLDEAGVCRASLESLAENASDGVVAPVFWGALLGLPGLAVYKAINTLDSMLGHKTEHLVDFGWCSARLDDVANFLPARITGVLIALASLRWQALTVMRRDARKHRSPNAGWPEAAMAGALGCRLSGPRVYAEGESREPWLNDGAADPIASDLRRGLALYVKAMVVAAALLLMLVLMLALGRAL